MKHTGTILFLLLGLMACTPEGRVFSEHQTLSPDVEWKSSDTKTFEIPITKAAQDYSMHIAFRYANGYPYKELRLAMTCTSPTGKLSEEIIQFNVRNDDGSYQGEPGYDIWDMQYLVSDTYSFDEIGNYRYTLNHAMPQDPVPFAMEIGIIVDRVVHSN